MIVRDLTPGTRPSRRRAAFTLLEVLVVVAILVILAGVATVSYFRYIEDAKVDSARASIDVLEKAARDFTIKNGGTPPGSLTELVAPSGGRKPFIDGGVAALNDPWGKPYQYDPSATNAQGDPDPMVYTTNPSDNNSQIFSSRRSKQ